MHMRCDVHAVASLCTAITMSGSATAWWVRVGDSGRWWEIVGDSGWGRAWWVRSMRSGSGASVEKIKIGSVREVCGPGKG